MTNSDIVELALNFIRENQVKPAMAFSNPNVAKDFCALRINLEDKRQEHFLVLYLNIQHKLIAERVEFHGSLNCSAVYPRVVAQHALDHNAAAVILCHNHPSGDVQPSSNDKQITKRIRDALGLFDIILLDHIVIAGSERYSFADNGLI